MAAAAAASGGFHPQTVLGVIKSWKSLVYQSKKIFDAWMHGTAHQELDDGNLWWWKSCRHHHQRRQLFQPQKYKSSFIKMYRTFYCWLSRGTFYFLWPQSIKVFIKNSAKSSKILSRTHLFEFIVLAHCNIKHSNLKSWKTPAPIWLQIQSKRNHLQFGTYQKGQSRTKWQPVMLFCIM